MAPYEAEIVSESDVKEGQLLKVVYEGRPVLLFRRENRIYAYLDVCPHVGGPLTLRSENLICQWHGSTFEATTGKYIRGLAPPGSELIPLPIEVKNGKIYYVFPPKKPRGQWHIS